ncbi:MAG: tRNA (adenosine(37)-N6)-threonylcarbamoyltransferase complex dimerization subunit type 1 TsaB [Clostridia bacterium]|nr:tRNA (adenosine(37)-N6)-threonylcarbamoyltransferase complex dimerization subunit type 1 TsaB [Clostridia bacterium]
MITLAFDGTAKIATVAVVDGDRALSSFTVDNGLTQSELLLPMAEDMLRALKLTFDDVELYAVSAGPGSFTGVRIGVSLIKGLAFGKSKPCIEVSTLEALAENLRGLDGILVPCMDARRSQVYNALFSSVGERITRLCEDRAIALSALAEELKEFKDKKIYISGDGYGVTKDTLASLGVNSESTPLLLRDESAVSVARVGIRKFLLGEHKTDSELSPVYLRLPQAERERLEKEGKKV